MSVSAIAAISARIATIESRFAAVAPVSATSVASSSTSSSGDPSGAFEDVLGSMQSVVPRDIAVPWSELSGMDWPTSTVAVPLLPGAGSTGSMESLDARSVAAGTPFATLFDDAGSRHGVPPRLLASIGWVESRYQTDVVSPDGAVGVMQLMPFVADHYGVDARNPAEAIDAAARLLADHHERFGSWDLAVASYFSGAGAVSRAGNTPPTARSHDYVRSVTDRLAFV